MLHNGVNGVFPTPHPLTTSHWFLQWAAVEHSHHRNQQTLQTSGLLNICRHICALGSPDTLKTKMNHEYTDSNVFIRLHSVLFEIFLDRRSPGNSIVKVCFSRRTWTGFLGTWGSLRVPSVKLPDLLADSCAYRM